MSKFFWLGVERFCKQHDFDDEDRLAMGDMLAKTAAAFKVAQGEEVQPEHPSPFMRGLRELWHTANMAMPWYEDTTMKTDPYAHGGKTWNQRQLENQAWRQRTQGWEPHVADLAGSKILDPKTKLMRPATDEENRSEALRRWSMRQPGAANALNPAVAKGFTSGARAEFEQQKAIANDPKQNPSVRQAAYQRMQALSEVDASGKPTAGTVGGLRVAGQSGGPVPEEQGADILADYQKRIGTDPAIFTSGELGFKHPGMAAMQKKYMDQLNNPSTAGHAKEMLDYLAHEAWRYKNVVNTTQDTIALRGSREGRRKFRGSDIGRNTVIEQQLFPRAPRKPKTTTRASQGYAAPAPPAQPVWTNNYGATRQGAPARAQAGQPPVYPKTWQPGQAPTKGPATSPNTLPMPTQPNAQSNANADLTSEAPAATGPSQPEELQDPSKWQMPGMPKYSSCLVKAALLPKKFWAGWKPVKPLQQTPGIPKQQNLSTPAPASISTQARTSALQTAQKTLGMPSWQPPAAPKRPSYMRAERSAGGPASWNPSPDTSYKFPNVGSSVETPTKTLIGEHAGGLEPSWNQRRARKDKLIPSYEEGLAEYEQRKANPTAFPTPEGDYGGPRMYAERSFATQEHPEFATPSWDRHPELVTDRLSAFAKDERTELANQEYRRKMDALKRPGAEEAAAAARGEAARERFEAVSRRMQAESRDPNSPSAQAQRAGAQAKADLSAMRAGSAEPIKRQSPEESYDALFKTPEPENKRWASGSDPFG